MRDERKGAGSLLIRPLVTEGGGARERTLSGVNLSMEGTSGAAECALLRGGAQEAALEGSSQLLPAFCREDGVLGRAQARTRVSAETARREAGCEALSS